MKNNNTLFFRFWNLLPKRQAY